MPKLRRVNQLKLTFGLAKYGMIASFRNKASLFFSLIFPLIFVMVFGFIGNNTSKIKLGISETLPATNPVYITLQDMADQENSPIELVHGTNDAFTEELNKGNVAAVLVPDDTASIGLLTSNSNPQGGATAEAFIDGVLNRMNLRAAGVIRPTFNVATNEISGKPYRYIDFALPGQIGFSLLFIATGGIAFPLITLRKTLVLKRMFATATTPLSFVVAQCASRSVQAVIQAAVLLLVGILAFDFSLAHGWMSAVYMLILSFIGILAFLGFGILIGNLALDENTVPIAMNLFNLPQILLAGVFFPNDSLPPFLKLVGDNLPLSYFNIAMRKIANDGASLADVWLYIVGILVWGILAYIAAAKVFKSEP